MKTEIRELLVELNDDELKLESSMLAEKIDALETLEAEKKSKTAEFNKDIKLLSREVIAQANIVKTGKAVRPVECRVEFNLKTETARVYRTDTQDIVDVRDMTREELQQDLFPSHIDD